MARLLAPPALQPLLKRDDAKTAQAETTAAREGTVAPAAITQLWRESLQTFSVHSVAMLTCVLFGLSSPFLIGHWIATQAVLQNMAWVGPVPTLQEKLPATSMIVIAFVVLLTSTLSQAIITQTALQRSQKSFLRWVIVNFPPLLTGQLAYGAIASLLILSLGAPVWNSDAAFQEVQFAPLWNQTGANISIVTRRLAWQGLGALIPSPGLAFRVMISEARMTLLRKEPATEYERWLIENNIQLAMQQSSVGWLQSMKPGLLGLTSLSCLVLLVVAEILLRFRLVLALEPPEAMSAYAGKSGGYRLWGFAAFSPLIRSARFGLRHFGTIALHVALLRLAGFALVMLFVDLPAMASMQSVMPALISLIGKTPLLPWMYFAQVAGATLIVAFVVSFNTVYDARLFVALSDRGG